MGKASREKGARAEREFAELCREAGFSEARRGCQLYQRGSEIADIEGLPYIHVECKHVEKLNIRAAMEQSERDAKDEKRGRLPIVAHRTNRKPWLITMAAADWMRIYKAALKSSKR